MSNRKIDNAVDLTKRLAATKCAAKGCDQPIKWLVRKRGQETSRFAALEWVCDAHREGRVSS